MDPTREFCLAQAGLCAQAAALATLFHQREKFLAAETAWTTLATRVDDARRARRRAAFG